MIKSLDALERLSYAITHDVNAYSQYTQSQPFIDKDKALVEKELKALEFIGKRFGSFILTVIENDLRTSKEERELLKEVLGK